MSRLNLTDHEKAALAFACTSCAASVEQWCYLDSGEYGWAGRLHTNRWNRARQVADWLGLEDLYLSNDNRVERLRAEIKAVQREADSIGAVILAELKTDTGKPSLDQLAWLKAAGPHGRLWAPKDWPEIEYTLKRKKVAA